MTFLTIGASTVPVYRVDAAPVRDSTTGEVLAHLVGQTVQITLRDSDTLFPILNEMGQPVAGSALVVNPTFSLPVFWISTNTPDDLFIDWRAADGTRGPVMFEAVLREEARRSREAAEAAAELAGVPTEDALSAAIAAADLASVPQVMDLQRRPSAPAVGSGPVQVGAARVDIPTPATTHNAFPGAVLLPDRTLLLCWRGGPSHVGGTDGRIFLARSGDLGVSWSAPVQIYDHTLDVRDPSLAISQDGQTLWLTFFTYNTPADPQYKSWVMASTDGGSTWATPVQITSTTAAIAAPVVEVSPGVLLAPLYGPVSGRDSVIIARSEDGGGTWTAGVPIANGATDSRDYQEPWLVRTPAGVVALYRWNNTEAIARSVSTDGGLTWSAPVRVFDGGGRPSAAYTATGALVCIYRELPSRVAVMRTSRDYGVTWEPQKLFDNDTVQMAYAAPVEVSPGVLAVPYSLERGVVSGSIGTLHVRYVLDGSGVSPLGDVNRPRVLAARTAPASPVMAFDDFARAPGPLGSTPTGATWSTPTGTVAIEDGVLRTTGAGVAVAYTTQAHGNVVVEVDLQWLGNTSPGVLVRGVSDNTFLYIAAEGSGSNIRLYKAESTGNTLLVTAANEFTRSGQWFTLRVNAYADVIQVFRDGHRIINHQLTSGDEATFAPMTARRTGFRMNAPTSGNVMKARRFVVTDNA